MGPGHHNGSKRPQWGSGLTMEAQGTQGGLATTRGPGDQKGAQGPRWGRGDHNEVRRPQWGPATRKPGNYQEFRTTMEPKDHNGTRVTQRGLHGDPDGAWEPQWVSGNHNGSPRHHNEGQDHNGDPGNIRGPGDDKGPGGKMGPGDHYGASGPRWGPC